MTFVATARGRDDGHTSTTDFFGDIGLSVKGGHRVSDAKEIFEKVRDGVTDCQCFYEVNIYGHGGPGEIHLGSNPNRYLDRTWMQSNGVLLAQAAAKMCVDSEIYLKACDVSKDVSDYAAGTLSGHPPYDLAQELANATGSVVHSHTGMYNASAAIDPFGLLPGRSTTDWISRPQGTVSGKSGPCAPDHCCPAPQSRWWHGPAGS